MCLSAATNVIEIFQYRQIETRSTGELVQCIGQTDKLVILDITEKYRFACTRRMKKFCRILSCQPSTKLLPAVESNTLSLLDRWSLQNDLSILRLYFQPSNVKSEV